ncbi:extensin-like [Perognathus longimembris pacificus]|uniref:extensin-like n=1 Tax=Perognathus longimembris pacificus TaxID=214514 RepID=UPI0020186BC2|nr:extensin-like [Perognathus longimembris pacificus]
MKVFYHACMTLASIAHMPYDALAVLHDSGIPYTDSYTTNLSKMTFSPHGNNKHSEICFSLLLAKNIPAFLSESAHWLLPTRRSQTCKVAGRTPKEDPGILPTPSPNWPHPKHPKGQNSSSLPLPRPLEPSRHNESRSKTASSAPPRAGQRRHSTSPTHQRPPGSRKPQPKLPPHPQPPAPSAAALGRKASRGRSPPSSAPLSRAPPPPPHPSRPPTPGSPLHPQRTNTASSSNRDSSSPPTACAFSPLEIPCSAISPSPPDHQAQSPALGYSLQSQFTHHPFIYIPGPESPNQHQHSPQNKTDQHTHTHTHTPISLKSKLLCPWGGGGPPKTGAQNRESWVRPAPEFHRPVQGQVSARPSSHSSPSFSNDVGWPGTCKSAWVSPPGKLERRRRAEDAEIPPPHLASPPSKPKRRAPSLWEGFVSQSQHPLLGQSPPTTATLQSSLTISLLLGEDFGDPREAVLGPTTPLRVASPLGLCSPTSGILWGYYRSLG